MKLLGIAGSLRAGSYNRRLLQLAADEPPRRRATTPSGVGLRDLPAFDEDEENASSFAVCGVPLGGSPTADAVLIVTPEYNGSIPGALKNALDWASRPRDTAAFRGKPVGRDRRQHRLVRRRLGARRDTQDPRPDGRTRRRGRALGRQGERAARRARRGAHRSAPCRRRPARHRSIRCAPRVAA